MLVSGFGGVPLVADIHSQYAVSSPVKSCPSCKGWKCLDCFSTEKNRKLQLSFGLVISSVVDPWVTAPEGGGYSKDCSDISWNLLMGGVCVCVHNDHECSLLQVVFEFVNCCRLTTSNNHLQEQGNWRLVTSMNLIHTICSHAKLSLGFLCCAKSLPWGLLLLCRTWHL